MFLFFLKKKYRYYDRPALMVIDLEAIVNNEQGGMVCIVR